MLILQGRMRLSGHDEGFRYLEIGLRRPEQLSHCTVTLH